MGEWALGVGRWARLRRCVAVPVVLGVSLASGCGDSTNSQRPTPNAQRPGSPTTQRSNEIQAPEEQHAAGSGITVQWQEPEENGGIRKILEVRADRGALDAVTQSGALKDAKGIFYREGKPRARFSAPEVIASRDKLTVVARGGVTVNSIEPAGVTLKAKQITWYAERQQIEARGSVYLSHTPKGANRPIAYGHVPQATANTELQTITVP